MISIILGPNEKVVVRPTIFPDGTSQVWKLPSIYPSQSHFHIRWDFEAERELFDLFNLRMLLGNMKLWDLEIPYLPYARQDKEVRNDMTFALRTFARLLNQLKCTNVISYDVHNPELTSNLIDNFVNRPAENFQREIVKKVDPDFLVYPDAGAFDRYPIARFFQDCEFLLFSKERDQETGRIINHAVNFDASSVDHLGFEIRRKKSYRKSRYLILDDICDGGATFLGIAHVLKSYDPEAEIHLAVSHGIFSWGREPLEAAGIQLHTTNSLLKNAGSYEV